MTNRKNTFSERTRPAKGSFLGSREHGEVFFSKMKNISAATLLAASDAQVEEFEAASLQESEEQLNILALNIPLAVTMLPSDMEENESSRSRTWPGLAPHDQPTLTTLTLVSEKTAITTVARIATHTHSDPRNLIDPSPTPGFCSITPLTNASMSSMSEKSLRNHSHYSQNSNHLPPTTLRTPLAHSQLRESETKLWRDCEIFRRRDLRRRGYL